MEAGDATGIPRGVRRRRRTGATFAADGIAEEMFELTAAL
jgi:hypothetical protein